MGEEGEIIYLQNLLSIDILKTQKQRMNRGRKVIVEEGGE
jgi:hypothetical protein